MERTRFGSSTASLRAASGVLRARASRTGLPLLPVGPADLAAAVVGVDAWMLVAQAQSLESPARHGPEAVRALAACLSRAAGHGQESPGPDLGECAQEPALVAAAERHADLARVLAPADAARTLALAASDLAAAGPGTRFAAYGALLLHVVA